MKIAGGFNEGPGMIEHLRELAEAEPFKPFTILMQTGKQFRIAKASHIQFTHYGSPKVLAITGSVPHPEEFSPRKPPTKWDILNPDAIAEVIP
jgi:hypothetical protein